jgi:ADP-ribose pyrophosphatase
MQPWETISRRTILDVSRFLRVESHEIQLPDGQRIYDWPWIITPDFVNIVAVTPQGKFILLRQTKYSIQGVGLAPIGGYIEPDEVPLSAAKRELLEETGYISDDWTHLGSYVVDGNRGAGTAHIFLAQNAVLPQVVDSCTQSDDLEEQELIVLDRDEVITTMMNHEFKVLPWVTAIALSLHHL